MEVQVRDRDGENICKLGNFKPSELKDVRYLIERYGIYAYDEDIIFDGSESYCGCQFLKEKGEETVFEIILE